MGVVRNYFWGAGVHTLNMGGIRFDLWWERSKTSTNFNPMREPSNDSAPPPSTPSYKFCPIPNNTKNLTIHVLYM